MEVTHKKNSGSARGLLVSYSGYPDMLNYFMPDNGLANLAGALLSAGHHVKILDIETVDFVNDSCLGDVRNLMDSISVLMHKRDTSKEMLSKPLISLEYSVRQKQKKLHYDIAETIISTLQKEHVDFIGFKLWGGIGYKGSIRIAEHIKSKCPNIPLFAGGPQADLYFEVLMEKTTAFNAIAIGDGEETIVALAEFALGKRHLDDIPNIVFRRGSALYRSQRNWIEDINQLPNPCYTHEVYPAMQGNNKIKVLTLDDSRGCPNLCHFCIHPLKSGSVLRKKTAFRIHNEIEHLRNNYGCFCFRCAGSSPPFMVSGETGINSEVCSQNSILYTAFLHASNVEHADMQKAHERGCYAVFIGLESANRKLLEEVYGKKVTLEQIEQAISSARSAGIYTVVSVIFPGPGESSKTKNETLTFLTNTRPDSVLVMLPRIYPGTEWYRNYHKYGFKFNSDNFVIKLMEFERPHFMPIFHGEPLCFTVNGRDHKTQIREAEEFVAELEGNGITVGISDETALLAYLAGYRGCEAKFRDKVKMAFLTGQTEILRDIVQKINDSVSRIATDDKALLTSSQEYHGKE